jgi:hypothetical protein
MEIYTDEYFEDDLYHTKMRVRVRTVNERHGKIIVKLDFEEWLP